MAIDPVSSQANIYQSQDVQKTNTVVPEKDKTPEVQSKPDEAYTVNISQQAIDQAQENQPSNTVIPQPKNRPLM
jgi:hypothetical protein